MYKVGLFSCETNDKLVIEIRYGGITPMPWCTGLEKGTSNFASNSKEYVPSIGLLVSWVESNVSNRFRFV